jgi:hypothetical protein
MAASSSTKAMVFGMLWFRRSSNRVCQCAHYTFEKPPLLKFDIKSSRVPHLRHISPKPSQHFLKLSHFLPLIGG